MGLKLFALYSTTNVGYKTIILFNFCPPLNCLSNLYRLEFRSTIRFGHSWDVVRWKYAKKILMFWPRSTSKENINSLVAISHLLVKFLIKDCPRNSNKNKKCELIVRIRSHYNHPLRTPNSVVGIRTTN